jgi:23S rRNA pseudouridine2604 synthase
MCEALGNKVFSLKRVRIMEYTVKGIAPGTWRYFTAQELTTLNQLLSKSSNNSSNGELGE